MTWRLLGGDVVDIAEFWRLIEASKQQAGDDCDLQADLLRQKLEALSLEEMVAFNSIYDQQDRLAFRYDLKAAANIINGSGADDGFTDFRAWLIAQGEAVFHRALKDLDSLAELDFAPDKDYECEQFAYAALYAYETKAGVEMPVENLPPIEIQGERWEYEQQEEILPRLWAKFDS